MRQVQVADPEVWGTCIGADLYRQYSSICNHQNQEACKQDPAGCTFIGEHEAEVRQTIHVQKDKLPVTNCTLRQHTCQ